jgi:hypothetical protein
MVGRHHSVRASKLVYCDGFHFPQSNDHGHPGLERDRLKAGLEDCTAFSIVAPIRRPEIPPSSTIRHQSNGKCEGEHATRMHVSTVVPKDKRSSAACFSIRSTNAFAVNEASSVQSAASTTSFVGALRRLRFRSVAIIVITPVKHLFGELDPSLSSAIALPFPFGFSALKHRRKD